MDSDITFGALVALVHECSIKFGVVLETASKTTIKGTEETVLVSYFDPNLKTATVPADCVELIDLRYGSIKTSSETAADRLIRRHNELLTSLALNESQARKEEAAALNAKPVEAAPVVISLPAEGGEQPPKSDIPF